MDEIYTKIQVYLLKKDKECEKLRFLTSRTTPSNDAHVSDVCETIKSILQYSTISKTDETEKSIQHFKFLLLNTNFRSQEYLCEDIANGHLVDMCPPLSPYLFIQIILALNYEDIICSSILYIPMDLCSEILDAVRRCLDIDFKRAFNLVLKIVSNCFKKLVSTIHKDTQILDEDESLKRFLGSIQELISSLSDLPTKKIENLSQILKYELCGWVLIGLLNTIKDCMAIKRSGNLPPNSNRELEKLHRVTFGRNFITRIDPEVVSDGVDFLTKELIELLLRNIKKIDCFVYMGWAELDYGEDGSMSMQRAVGLTCYHFIEFLKADDQHCEEYSHVVECLQQLSSKPDAPFSMSLKELCSEVEKGNKDCLKKLIQRFEEWDSAAISCLEENRSIVEKGNCLNLLNSASKFFAISTDEGIRLQAYTTAMKILLGQRLVDMVEVIVQFILIHNASRKLESRNFDGDLRSYVNQGAALCSGKTSLRIILFFVIQNPKEVLKTLIEAGIGYPEYTNSMISAEDFCKLSPITKIQDSNKLSLLLNTVKEICDENVPWNGKKFVNFIRVLLNKGLISADEILNSIFIPVLKNKIILQNLQSILTCIRSMKDDFTQKIKRRELLYAFALQMRYWRKNTEISLNSREEILNLLVRIIKQFSNARARNSSIDNESDLFIEKLEARLEPLDRIYFTEEWASIRNEISVDLVLQDYKKRCFYVLNESKPGSNCSADFEELLESHGLKTDAFLQQLILQCTEFEYLKFAKEAVILHWNYFRWENELDAYAQFSLSTIKACNNYLDSYDPTNRRDLLAQKIASLVKSLAKLTTWFISIDVMEDYESVHRSLVSAMNVLNLKTDFLSNSLPSDQEFGTRSTQSTKSSYETIVELIRDVEKFGDQCLDLCNQKFETLDPNSPSAMQFNLISTFISICLNWPVGENCLLLSKMDKKLYSKQRDGVHRNVTH